MKLLVSDIPDDPAELPRWLDRHLVGLDLGALVAELTAVHGPSDEPSLTDVLGDRREAVLAGGLSALPAPSLRRLLRHPRLLPRLQELVLTEGGPYWRRLTEADAALQTRALRGEGRLADLFAEPAPTLPLRPAASPSPQTRGVGWRYAMASLTTAAAVLLAVFLFREPLARRVLGTGPPPAASTAWGWEKLAAPAPGTPAPDYLNALADAAHEWFDQRPADAPALAQRIGEMRLGCSRLILAEHTPLKDPEERRWLRDKCRAWATKFDKSLTELEGGRPADQVREEMDGTVRKAVVTLRERAELLKAG